MAVLISNASADHNVEDRLTAVLIGRFASYVEWPPTERSHFVITVLGENPFGTILDDLYHSKLIQNKPVKLQYAKTLNQVSPTDILFINLHNTSSRLAAIRFAHQHGILSISDSRGFADSGGLIQLNVVEQKTQLKINHAAAVDSGLTIGSPLLSIATVLRKDQP